MNEVETPCLCYPQEARQHKPIRREWKGGTLWAIFPECPAHPGEHFKSPEWAQRIGRLVTNETASGELAVS